jgi:hypothetical protein
MKNIFITLTLGLLSIPLFSADISGKVSLENPFKTMETPQLQATAELISMEEGKPSKVFPIIGSGFYFNNVEAGKYRLVVTQNRYSSYVEDIVVDPDSDTKLDVELKLNALSGRVSEDVVFDRNYIVLEGDEFVVENGFCLKNGSYEIINAGSLTVEEVKED